MPASARQIPARPSKSVEKINPPMLMNDLQEQLLEYFVTQPTTGDNVQIENWMPLKSGWASDVYSFTLAYDEGGETVRQHLVLKAYTNSDAGKDRALKERHALYNLRTARYPVPGVAAVEIAPDHIGRPFIIMEHIEGETMMDKFEATDERGQQELVQQLVGLMTQLHDMGADVLVSNLGSKSDLVLVNREIHTMRGLVNTYNLGMFTPVLDWLYANRQSVPCDTPVVTHRDFHPWNILINTQGMPYVIDWGWQLSDPRFDVAWTYTLLDRSGYPELAEAFLTEYKRVKSDVGELDYFKVMATTRWLMTIITSLRTGEALREGMINEFRMAMKGPVSKARELIADLTGVELPSTDSLLQS